MSLLGYYKLDEGTGSVILDSSGNGFHGTWSNTPAWSSSVPSAIQFTDPYCVSLGGFQYLNLPNLGLSGNVPLTICLWVAKSLTTLQEIFSFGTSSASGNVELLFDYPSAGNYSLFHANTVVISTTPSSLIGWHHIAFVSDGSNISLYVDGALVGSMSYVLTVANANFKIGCSGPQSGLYPFNGSIDDVRIYDVDLNATQIGRLASGLPSPFAATTLFRRKANSRTGSRSAA